MIGLVAVTAAGHASAQCVASAWPERTRTYPAPASTALPRAFSECEAVVAFLAAGVVIRLLAPVLSRGGKHTEPAVVCVDQGRRFAVALLGGHLGGANQLAREVADLLGARPVVTTATDAMGVSALDDVDLPVEGDVAGVARAMLDDEPVAMVTERAWPLPAFPPNVRPGEVDPGPETPGILVTDRAVGWRRLRATLRPPTLALGIGASTNADPQELMALAEAALAEAGLASACVRELATLDRRANEPALVQLAGRFRAPIRAFSSETLAAQNAPNPSQVVRDAVGTPSVAEASVLASGAELVLGKRRSACCTVAIGRFPVRGRLALVGIGPGSRDLLTPRAVAELRSASVVVGLVRYLDQVRDLLRPGTEVVDSGMGDERGRATTAIARAQAGASVALVGSGDAGVYAMASPTLEILGASLAGGGPQIDVVGVPGITAALAASNLLGAPLGNDHACVSLSDLHTPWETVERRLVAVAEGDFTVALYNPRSRGRADHLRAALRILSQNRPPSTPVGLVRNACRTGERVEITTLAEVEVETVDMLTVVIVGASDTRNVDGRMVTPRGYQWMS